jgi:FAD/FMN-containing dehydrogenase/Fe-S oxidoreductase
VSHDRQPSRIAAELQATIEGEVRFARHDRLLYATDASIYQVEPLGVVIPRTVADVEAAVRCCARHGLPILPRGAGTSLAGQAVNQAVVIDLSRHLTGVLAIDARARTSHVEPGVVLDALNAALHPLGLIFGPDVATSTHATIGGMIGNNSAGARSLCYGRTVEHVQALDVLMADGERVWLEEGAAARPGRVRELTRAVAGVVLPLAEEIDRRFPKTLRRVNGYNLDLLLASVRASGPELERVNLAKLACGSEGTLGLTVGARIGLVPRPAVRGLVIVAFEDVDQALGAVVDILAGQPSAVELLDAMILSLARDNREFRPIVDLLPRPGGRDPGAVLYVEHSGDDASAVATRLDALRHRFAFDRTSCHLDPAEMGQAWRLRKAGEPLLYGMHGPRRPITFIEDMAVPPADLPAFVARFRRILDAHGTRAAFYAHASVGCLHIRPLIDLGDPEDVERMTSIATQATDLVMAFGGALSGEHGDGRLRSHLLRRFYGERICDGLAAIKAIFDPHGRMNPGNIVAPPPMTVALRVRPEGRPAEVPVVRTHFNFGPEHGLNEAVHMCNGAGVCRRTEGGTMCPSYRATRDERHATRGRGNALRLAITGQFGHGAGPDWNDAETLRTLDLCLSCKACKRECPSNVDVAKLKSEYLAQSFRSAGGPPRRLRMLAQVRRLNRAGAVWPAASNWLARRRLARSCAAAILGFDPRRSLPRFGRPLDRRLRRSAAEFAGARGPAVILLPDCFTVYNEPHIGEAAAEVLRRLGYRVVLPDLPCCGRPHISLGLLDQALVTCARAASQLKEAVARHDAVAVVGCEPSCVSAVADDWPDLRLDVGGLDAIAAKTFPIEEFLARAAHPAPLEFHPGGAGSVLLHGHCHQRALWGIDGPAGLLGRNLGSRLRVLDAGCCGMAGAFGMQRGHYELSMQIGGLALFPAIRASPDALLLAPGTSCRHQIEEGTGRLALHPVQVLAEWSRPPATP